MKQERIAVLGAGSWGTALAVAIARNGYPVILWARDKNFVREINRARCNRRYLPHCPLPENLAISDDLCATVTACCDFLIAVPSHAFTDAVQNIVDALGNGRGDDCNDERDDDRIPEPITLAWGTKGLEPQSGRLLSCVVAELAPSCHSAVISGPSFAREMASNLPTALTVASQDMQTAKRVAGWLRGENLRVYTGNDIIGVQLGGVVKNIIAIAAGISDGLQLGANARAALITRGLTELARFGEAYSGGGARATLYGLSGVGDLILSCTDDQSRNRRVGLGLARGQTLTEILRELGQEAEGVTTVRTLYPLRNKLSVHMPITEQVYKVLFEGRAPRDAVQSLLSREATEE